MTVNTISKVRTRVLTLLAMLVLGATLLAAGATSASAATSPNTLRGGQQLSQLVSSNGRYRLVSQADGKVVFLDNGHARWWAMGPTAASPGARAVMQGDGNFVIYNTAGTALWHTHTYQYHGARLVLQNDGNIVVYDSANVARWSAGTYQQNALFGDARLLPGQQVTSRNGQTKLVMQSNGVLALRDGRGRTLWTSALAYGGSSTARAAFNSPNAYAQMQGDGNLVIYNTAAAPVWYTGTWGHPDATLIVQDDGNLVIYTNSGQVLFQTFTAIGGRANGDTLSYDPGTGGQCTWAASMKFHDFTGVFPNTFGSAGNALNWGKNAAGHHWTVVDGPAVASMAVFQPGQAGASAPYGHVAWVDYVHPDGVHFDILEMNFTYGAGRWDYRYNVTDTAGISFVLAP